jgi:hypothetical protein
MQFSSVDRILFFGNNITLGRSFNIELLPDEMDKLPLNYAQMRRLDAGSKPLIDYYYYYYHTLHYTRHEWDVMLRPQFTHIPHTPLSRHANRGKMHSIRGEGSHIAIWRQLCSFS